MPRTAQQQAHGLLTVYESLYADKYNRKPKINRYADKWGFVDVLSDMSEGRARTLLEFYFKTTSPSNHSLKWFFFNYDKLLASLEAKEQDEKARRQLRVETEARVRAYKEKYGDQRRTTD